MKPFKQKYNYALTYSIMIMLSIIMLVVIFFMTTKNYDQTGANIKNFDTISTLKAENNNSLFEQTFVSKNKNLDKIIFYYNNKDATNTLEFSIIEYGDDNLIRSEKITVPPEINSQLFTWDFEDITDSKNKKYSFLILTEKNNFEIITTPANRYENGELFFNSKKMEEQIMAFSFDFYSKNLFSILQERIGIYKPGIFQNPWVFNILFVITILSTGASVYLVTKNILD